MRNTTKEKQNDWLADYDWHEWTANNLRKDRYTITDIDAVIRDTMPDGTNRIQIIEKKAFNSEPRECQCITYRILDALIREGLKATDGKVNIKICGRMQQISVEYLGTHLLQLSNATFDQSEFKFDREDVDLSTLIDKLNFTNHTTV
jgi:hypothetical protein